MISFKGIFLTLFFVILSIGFTDFFVQFENRCEMTYMYQVPQYVPISIGQSAKRIYPKYNLYVYGEGDYVDTLRLNDFNGNPVLFVPGNGGSYKQTRSLASVSLVMSYSSRSAYFNYFSVDYDEELSAFIGYKLEYQTKFLYLSIKKIVQLYHHSPKTKLILIGHSIGGILIKALFSKPYFRPYLEKVAVVFTLATPHIAPAIPFDMKIVNFYSETNSQFSLYRHLNYSHINFVSMGGSTNDKLIRSDMIPIDTGYKYDRSILTTAIDDVWASADHLCIVWCRQLMVKLNNIFFDLLQDDKSLISSPAQRQEIIDYHLFNRYFQGIFPGYDLPNETFYSNTTDTVEHTNRLIRLNINKLIKPANHLVPLNERETIVLHFEGMFRPDTLSVCSATRIEGKISSNGLNLYRIVRLVPTNTKTDRHLAHIDSEEYIRLGYTHLVVSLKPSPSSFSILIDRFTTFLRHKSITLPNLSVGLFTGGLMKPVPIFTKLISQEQTYFNLTLENFDSIWQTYYIRMNTKSCYTKMSSFMGYSYLSLSQQELNEYNWPFLPLKNFNLNFILKLNQVHQSSPTIKPSLLLFLEPNCGYEMFAQFSLVNSSAQLVKHYFVLLVPLIISVAILILSVQLCNMLLLYSFSNEDLDQLKTKFGNEMADNKLVNKKCFVFMTTSQVMISGRYFLYCLVQTVFFCVLAIFILKKFYPHHDLSNLSELPPFSLVTICSFLFFLAYSLVYVFTMAVHFLGDNFADGVIYFYQRSKLLPFQIPFFDKIVSFQWNHVCTCFAVTISFAAFNYFIQSMLVRFIQVNYTELKIGRTTSTSFIRSIFPSIYALQFALSILQIPISLDSYHSIQENRIQPIISQSSFSAALFIVIYLLIHTRPLDLTCRLTVFHKYLNMTLILLAFCNILIGALAFEFISNSILVTLAIIMVANMQLHKQIMGKRELKAD
ncbi:GPI inositol-deacylase [Blomia tropicalis]|nr:GPI inositol-deacylase [Blomia tropicalis]